MEYKSHWSLRAKVDILNILKHCNIRQMVNYPWSTLFTFNNWGRISAKSLEFAAQLFTQFLSLYYEGNSLETGWRVPVREHVMDQRCGFLLVSCFLKYIKSLPSAWTSKYYIKILLQGSPVAIQLAVTTVQCKPRKKN